MTKLEQILLNGNNIAIVRAPAGQSQSCRYQRVEPSPPLPTLWMACVHSLRISNQRKGLTSGVVILPRRAARSWWRTRRRVTSGREMGSQPGLRRVELRRGARGLLRYARAAERRMFWSVAVCPVVTTCARFLLWVEWLRQAQLALHFEILCSNHVMGRQYVIVTGMSLLPPRLCILEETIIRLERGGHKLEPDG